MAGIMKHIERYHDASACFMVLWDSSSESVSIQQQLSSLYSDFFLSFNAITEAKNSSTVLSGRIHRCPSFSPIREGALNNYHSGLFAIYLLYICFVVL